MAYGLRVRNESNFLQIDSTFKNYRFRERRTVSTVAIYGNTGLYSYAEVRIGGGAAVRPIIAHKNAFFTYMVGPTPSGADAVGWVAVEGGIGTTFDIWIFDASPPVNTPGDYGLRIKNEVGEIAFNSQLQWMKPVSQVSAFPNSLADPGTLILSGAVDLGVVQTVGAFNLAYLNLPPQPGFPVRYNIGHWPMMHRKTSGVSIEAAYRTNVGESGPFTGSAVQGGSKTAYGFLGVDLSGV